MLAIATLTTRAAPYYTAQHLREPPPGDPREAPGLAGSHGERVAVIAEQLAGVWDGVAARSLGLVGAVDRAGLVALLEGRPGPEGPVLRRRPGTVGGFDVTFSAPKSASILFALAPPEIAGTVLEAHRDAVRSALAYLEARAVAVRRTSQSERHTVPTTGVAAALFTHGTSRAQEPHLHTHVVVANLGHGPDGRWTAIDGRGLRAHGRAAGALYEAELRARLREGLGARWVARPAGHFEIAGVDPLVIAAFSSRAAEIRADLGAHGLHSPRATRVAAARTRDHKALPRSPEARRAGWVARATEMGWAPEVLSSWLGHDRRAPAELDEGRFAALLLGANPREVTRRDVVGAWAGALPPGARASDVLACVAAWLPDSPSDLGVREARYGPRQVVPSPLALELLGPRPAQPGLQGVWREAAEGLARYAARFGDRSARLVPDPPDLSSASLGARQLAARLHVQRQVTLARTRLGRDRDRRAESLALWRER